MTVGDEMFEPPAVKTFWFIAVASSSESATNVETTSFIRTPLCWEEYTFWLYNYVNSRSMIYTMNFGKRFLEARLAAGLTQAELADGLVTPGYISHIEQGIRIPGKKIIATLSSRLGVDLTEYLADSEFNSSDFELAQIQVLAANGETEQALKKIKQLESNPNTTPYANQRARFIKSIIQIDSGNASSAITTLNAIFDETKKISFRSEIAIQLISAYRDNDEFQYGITAGEGFIKLANSEQWSKADLITLICQVANLHLILGNNKRALDLSNQAKVLTEEFKDPRSISQAHWVASTILSKDGEISKSKEQMEIAIKFAELAELSSRIPIMKNDLAFQLSHGSKNEILEGIKLAESAFLEASVLGQSSTKMYAAETLFCCFFELADFKNAKKYLDIAQSISEEIDGIGIQGITFSRAKLQFQADQDLQAMFKTFKAAAKMDQMFSHQVMLEWKYLAAEAKKLGNFEIASHALEEALDIQVKLGV